MRYPCGLLLLFACLSLPLLGKVSAASGLATAPMLLPAAPLDASVWVQTVAETEVVLQLWDDAHKQWQTADQARTSRLHRYTAVLTAEGLTPGHTYTARILAADTQAEQPLVLRTAPLHPRQGAEPEFSLFVAAGVDPASVAFEQLPLSPVMSLWLDSPLLSEAEYTSPTGPMAAHRRFRQAEAFSSSFSASQHVCIPGPGSFGPPGSDATLWSQGFFRTAQDTYWPTPLTGTSGQPFGAGGWTWRWADAELFFLDTEVLRNTAAKQILGPAQLDWLLSALSQSKARFKIIISGVPLLPAAQSSSSFINSPAERERLIDALRQPGVLVVSATTDGPGELSHAPPAAAAPFYELTLGSSSRPGPQDTIVNYLREAGTLVNVPHYAHIEFKGTGAGRHIHVSVWTPQGEQLWASRLRTHLPRP